MGTGFISDPKFKKRKLSRSAPISTGRSVPNFVEIGREIRKVGVEVNLRP